MEERTLELTVISATDLKKVSTFGQETCYAVAYIYTSDKKSSKVDRDGGVNPNWNAKLTLTCDDKLLHRAGWHITVEIYSFGTFSNKLVGTSKISLLDVGKQSEGESRKMSFEVRRPSGRTKGVLNVSVKVGEVRTLSKKNQSGQAFAEYPSGDPRKRPQQENGAPLGYPQAYPSWNSEAPSAYPPPKVDVYAAGATSVYPPPKASSDSVSSNSAGAVYPPPKASGGSSGTSTDGSKKQEDPVMAYPVYPQQQYGQQYGYSQQYGQQYPGGPQQYYYPSQASYGYQQGYQQQQTQYSKPSRWGGSSSSSGGGLGGGRGGGAGLGLLGGVLGGLLLGDVIGDIF